VFSCVFTVFFCKNTYFWYISHIYTKIYMYHIFFIKCIVFSSVFMCVHCVFIAATFTFGTFHIYIPKYTCTIYPTWNAQFCWFFHVCLLGFHCRNICFWYISHVYTKIHMYHIFYMKCTVLLVFSCFFTVFSMQKHVLLVHFTCIYQNTHKSYILHEIHSFVCVFMSFHCVFTAETWTYALTGMWQEQINGSL
jgi:hypothetical protein